MKILRVFNNNVVLARDADRQEIIATGRGIGFQARPGQLIDPARVTKVFVPDNGRDADNFGNLVAAIAPEYLQLADLALQSVRGSVPEQTISTTVVALADHLAFAVRRRQQGIEVEYPLQAEVIYLYPDELEVARRIVAFVNERVDAPLPDEEAVAIALHLVNAGFATGDLARTYQMTGVFSQLFDVLEQASGQPVDRNSVNAARFITHVRYFFVRAHSGRQLGDGARQLGDAIRTAYPAAHSVARKLENVLELRLGAPLSDDEVTYLTLHVARLIDDARG